MSHFSFDCVGKEQRSTTIGGADSGHSSFTILYFWPARVTGSAESFSLAGQFVAEFSAVVDFAAPMAKCGRGVRLASNAARARSLPFRYVTMQRRIRSSHSVTAAPDVLAARQFAPAPRVVARRVVPACAARFACSDEFWSGQCSRVCRATQRP